MCTYQRENGKAPCCTYDCNGCMWYEEDEDEKERMNKMPEIGDKIRIICMNGEPQYTDREGIVESIDDMGQIHGTWGGCALIPIVDSWEIIKKG